MTQVPPRCRNSLVMTENGPQQGIDGRVTPAQTGIRRLFFLLSAPDSPHFPEVADAAFQVLLYYLYVPLEDPERFAHEHRALCERLSLEGRILIAAEGINGTVSGPREATREYMRVMREDPRTSAMEFKVDEADGHVFSRLSVKLRDEVVTLGLGEEDLKPWNLTGEYLDPAAWRDMMDDENAVIIDARNDYEWELGRFEGALLPEVASFRDLPGWIREHRSELEGRKIMTYCTGGIRCEKFSGFLKQEGFPEVYQLHGGIVSYGKDPGVRGEKFEGKCYVFDERIGVAVNRTGGATVVSRCRHCGVPSDRYVNCAWKPCNERHFSCDACEREHARYCDRACAGAAVVSLAADCNE